MKNKPLSEYNAERVLQKVELLIDGDKGQRGGYLIREVYSDLSIFDWFTEKLSFAKLIQMRTFLRLAIKLGYKGYVCFKVGASGCANGMWAYKEESTDGHSPRCDNLYRSFTPDYTYYSVEINGRYLPSGVDFNKLKTPKMLEEFINELEHKEDAK